MTGELFSVRKTASQVSKDVREILANNEVSEIRITRGTTKEYFVFVEV